METSLPLITPEMRAALVASGGAPIQVQDPQTQQVYLMEPVVEITLDEQYMREKIEEGLAAIEAGDVVPWDPERIKRLGRERLAARRAPSNG
jgi:hypothetical protein